MTLQKKIDEWIGETKWIAPPDELPMYQSYEKALQDLRQRIPELIESIGKEVIVESDIELLKRIRNYLPSGFGTMCTNAVYISPAQQLRNQADEIENKDRDAKLFNELIQRLTK